MLKQALNRIRGVSRHPILQASLFAAALSLYTGALLLWSVRAEQQARTSAEQSLRLQVENRAQTVSYLFKRWQEEVQRLANAPEINNFYTNKALGMSMEYGLRANLLRIKQRFRAHIRDHFRDGKPLMTRIILVERDGQVLVEADHAELPLGSGPTTQPTTEAATEAATEPASENASAAPPEGEPRGQPLRQSDYAQITGGPSLTAADAEQQAAIWVAPDKQALLVHATVLHKGRYQGQVLIRLAPETVAQLTVGKQRQDLAGDYLMQRDGRVVLPTQVDLALKTALRRLACSDCPEVLERFQINGGDGTDPLVLASASIPETPFWLAMVRPSAEVFPYQTPTAMRATVAALALLGIVALTIITRFRQSNRVLKERFADAQRQETLLRNEIDRRQRVEAELRENEARLSQQGRDLELAMQEAHDLAFYDPLTGLANRVLFHKRLNAAIDGDADRLKGVAVLFLDLDRFKRINDTLGHHIGDLLLEQVAERLSASVRESDLVSKINVKLGDHLIARLGGDEFTVVLTDLRLAEEASRAAQRLNKAVSVPMTLEGLEVEITTSIGISLYPADGTDMETLIRNADAAMYSAKARGGNTFCFYEASMNELARRRLELESELRKALKQGELSVYFQPQLELASKRVAGAEALVRWHHPSKGEIQPFDFISTAEECGLINPLTQQVLYCACREAAAWPKTAGRALRVAVNLSAQSFATHDLCEMISGILDETGLAAEQLEVEITETVLLENREDAIRVLGGLKALGIQTALDDFGTGYSSLSYLKAFPIHSLKIDRSFVKDVETDGNDAAIVRAVIALADALDIQTVAEGVETAGQERFLEELGCNLVQGFRYARALSPDDFRSYLAGEQTRLNPEEHPDADRPA